MKISIPKKRRKHILYYLVALIALYLVIVLVPKATDAFESTEILEPGDLKLSCETSGYFIKKEAIATAENAGSLEYEYKPGVIVGKGWKMTSIDSGEAIQEAEGNVSSAFASQMKDLKGFERLKETNRSPISGIFSLSMDGNEAFFSPENLESIRRDEAESRSTKSKSLKRTSTTAGDPIFKITSDGRWYFVCWLKEKQRELFEQGQEVTLMLPGGDVEGTIYSIDKEKKRFRVVFTSNRYYKGLENARHEDVTITGRNVSGLLIDNDCIIEKKGKEGVYVRDKNGDYAFTPVQVISTDGKRSILAESRFYDEKGKTVLTVSVYDEISTNPKGELKRDLKREAEEKEEKKKNKNNNEEEEQ